MVFGQIEICEYDYWIKGIYVIQEKLSFFGKFGVLTQKKCKKGILVIGQKGIFVIFYLRVFW